MNEIKLKDVNFSLLTKLSEQGSMSVVYTDGTLCYKIFNEMAACDNRNLYYKMRDMDGLLLDDVLMPIDLIMDGITLCGCTMPYFEDSVTLSRKFGTRRFEINDLLKSVFYASKIIRGLHKKNVVCQDVSSNNILINSDGVIKFCDADSYTYLDKEHYSDTYSRVFANYLTNYKQGTVPTYEDVDRLSMFLIFYTVLFGYEVANIPKRQYNSLSRKANTLRNLRENFMQLKDKDSPIDEELPYLDEFIDLSDHYVVDRNKILTIGQKVHKFFD